MEVSSGQHIIGSWALDSTATLASRPRSIQRRCSVMKRAFVVAALCCWSWLQLPTFAAAQAPGELTSRDIVRVLQAPIDMKDFQNPMTLKEVLGLFYERTADAGLLGRGVGLPILVNQQAFKDVNPEAGDIYESPVK